MQSSPQLDALASFVSMLRTEDLPHDVVEKARLCLIDGISAMLATVISGNNKSAIAALDAQREHGGEAIVFGGRFAAAETAAFLNASSAAHAISNDTHLASATHPGMVIVPSLLAVAQTVPAAGSDLLAAIVAGYEAMIRVGAAIVTPELASYFRPTGLAGPIGAAAAVARLYGLKTGQAGHAMALAANTSGGLNEWARFGTDEHVFHSGLAARNGITMAKLARGGTVAAPTTLEGPSGLFAAFGDRQRCDALGTGLGVEFKICDVVHKPVPACVFVQVPAALAMQLAATPDFDAADVERVDIRVSRQAAEFPGCDNAGPIITPSAAQQSHQFAIASVLARRAIVNADWASPGEAGLDALSSRCNVVIDMDATGSSGSGARLDVHMKDGRSHSLSAAAFEGMGSQDVIDRFRVVATACYGKNVATDMIRTIEAVEKPGAMNRLLSLLASRTR